VTRAAILRPVTVYGATDLPRYVSANTFREALAISNRAFRRGPAAGRIPTPDLRWGRSLRWRVETVRDFLGSLEAEQEPKRPSGASYDGNRENT
jgi:hypothetical protein